MKYKGFRTLALLLAFSLFYLSLGLAAPASAFTFNSDDYAARKALYIQEGLKSDSRDRLILQAYKGEELDQTALNYYLDVVRDGGKEIADFDLARLIRVMLLRPETQEQIIKVLTDEEDTVNPQPFRFWFTKGEKEHCYWSENHMILYTSSQYLLQEKLGLFPDDRTYPRLKKYLEVKNKYGYYEFFSTTYLPYTLLGLLNLVDFAEDEEIRKLAAGATERLLKDILLMTNDEGVIFPVSGRMYRGYKEKGTGHNINKIIYLLTGLRESENLEPSAAGVFLATSTFEPTDDVYTYFDTDLNMDYAIGHSYRDVKTSIYSEFSREELVPFIWSQGGYFHPEFAVDSKYLLDYYDLWDHPHFKDLAFLEGKSDFLVQQASDRAAHMSRSTLLSSVNIGVYKDGGVTLSSIENYNSGYQGYQQMPWIATTGSLPVWTQSGKDTSKNMANTHLPKIIQKNNVALISYNPLFVIDTISDCDVWLYWPEGFDEEVTNGKWKFGREDDGYIAVRTPSTNVVDGYITCSDGEQTWAVIVGTEEQYGSFNDFVTKVTDEVDFDADWELHGPWYEFNYVYDADIKFDGTSISLTWD